MTLLVPNHFFINKNISRRVRDLEWNELELFFPKGEFIKELYGGLGKTREFGKKWRARTP